MASDLELVIRILPWLVKHPGTSARDVAAHFSVTESQVWDLLNLLVFTGAHQYGGGLVDIELDDKEYIVVREAQRLDRPVRLTRLEATTLVGGLTYLQQVGTVVSPVQVELLISKLRALLSDAPAPLDIVTTPVNPKFLNLVNLAISQGTCLDIEYGSADDHEVSRRTIEPLRLETQDDRSYVIAWCREAEGKRSFRFDRIHSMMSNSDSQVNVLSDSTTSDDYAHRAEVVIEPGVLGEIVQSSIIESAPLADGRIKLTIEAGNLEWLARLVVASGGQVEAREPAELTALVQGIIARRLT